VHGFTSAFSVGVGLMVLAAIVVMSLISARRRDDMDDGATAYDVDSPLAVAAA
jgi:hypothetical protein